jgi:hypothetical protein
MTTLSRTALLFVSAALVASTIACSSATPEPGSDSTEQDIKRGSSSTDPTGPSKPGAPTMPTDAGSSADAHADASAACCDPAAKPDGYYPEGISCCADGAWHESLGAGPSHTCATHGGVSAVCEAAPAETCGGPPMTAFCAACPGGNNGYKQIDGQPTCKCCTTP